MDEEKGGHVTIFFSQWKKIKKVADKNGIDITYFRYFEV